MPSPVKRDEPIIFFEMNGMTMEHTNTNLLTTPNAEQTAEAIKAAGCVVTSIEHDGVVRLHSASHGIGFQVLWGNETAPGCP